MRPKRYFMLEKAEGGAVVVDREKVVLALGRDAGCTIVLVDRTGFDLSLPLDEAAELLTLRLRFPGPLGAEQQPAACNRDHFISADEMDDGFRIRFTNGTDSVIPGITAEMFLDAILQMEQNDQA